MNIFVPTLNQLAFLFGFIAIGYLLVKCGLIPKDSSVILSKLENMVFIPGLILGTFIENFTVERIASAWKLMSISFLIAVIVIPLAVLISRLVTRDKYIQNIYTYGLSFSNFGFMGNAVVSALYPEIFFEYLIFTLPLWILIYLWGVSKLLISDSGKKQTFTQSIKSFANPMFFSMIIGMIIGLANIKLPSWTVSIITVSGQCMSPVAMLLTGIVVSSISIKEAFTNVRIYMISFVRLVVFPLALIVFSLFLPIHKTIYICALCSLAMPLGLNTIVIPGALNKDTTVAAGMTIVSHLLSCITIPIILSL